ncbi:MAG: abortive infection family protein [Rhodospirillales bacterium]|nr:abortive infection family protein [Rhodospirillales bacterium]
MTVAATSSFTMHGARDAMEAGLGHIEQQVLGIERAVFENPALAFDLAKTLIESTCRTVLGERSVPYDAGDDLPRLFWLAARVLPFLPPTASTAAEVRNSLRQTLVGLSTAVQGICELRNHCGFASHGSGRPRPAMEAVQALLAAEAADAIVGFLHRVHRQDRAPPPSPGPRFEDNEAFNGHVDETFGSIRIFEAEFRASEVLYQLEPETYRIGLAEFDGGAAEAAASAEEGA